MPARDLILADPVERRRALAALAEIQGKRTSAWEFVLWPDLPTFLVQVARAAGMRRRRAAERDLATLPEILKGTGSTGRYRNLAALVTCALELAALVPYYPRLAGQADVARRRAEYERAQACRRNGGKAGRS
jgi:hypothetical protein